MPTRMVYCFIQSRNRLAELATGTSRSKGDIQRSITGKWSWADAVHALDQLCSAQNAFSEKYGILSHIDVVKRAFSYMLHLASGILQIDLFIRLKLKTATFFLGTCSAVIRRWYRFRPCLQGAVPVQILNGWTEKGPFVPAFNVTFVKLSIVPISAFVNTS